MLWASAAAPEAAAIAAVLAGLVVATAMRAAPVAMRRIMLGLACAAVLIGLSLRRSDDPGGVLAADLACSASLAVLIFTAGLNRLPPGLVRMARAAGAGWGSIAFHTVLRPLAPRLLACTAIGIVLTACDAGLPDRLGVGGSLGPTLALAVCGIVGLALCLGKATS